MMERRPIKHEFVDEVPSVREEGTLYVSLKYRTAIHNCFCGCGSKIVTPIRPTKWKFTFDGDTISLSPSVGNWSYPCRSHYVIRSGVAIPAGDMSDHEIEAGRNRDRRLEERYFGVIEEPEIVLPPAHGAEVKPAQPQRRGFWNWLLGK